MEKAKKKYAPGLTTAQVTERLRIKYSDAEWAFVQQVPMRAGYTGGADAIAMNLWKSRGFVVYGFEIKVSRSDMLTELKKPKKADVVADYCDYWWVVVGDKSIVKPEELPKPWGLIIPWGDGLKVEKHVESLDPEPMTRGFIAGLMRRAKQQRIFPKSDIQRAYNEGEEAGFKKAEAKFEDKLKRRLQNEGRHYVEKSSKNDGAAQVLAEFKKLTGVDLSTWNVKDIAKLHEAMKDKSGGAFLAELQLLAREMKKYRGQHTVAKRHAQAIIEHLESQGIEVPLNLKP